jgi:16S rRNA (guanine527-N7)-methyltransferase
MSQRLLVDPAGNAEDHDESGSSGTNLRLDLFRRELFRWRKTTSLISHQSHIELWRRHIADSRQILNLAPTARRWLDIGSGAGFPGIIIAIQLYGVQQAEVHCVESDKRKCAFLAHVARETGVPAIIHPVRIEEIESASLLPIDAVTSRALTSLPRLLILCKDYIESGAIGIFPRGRSFTDADTDQVSKGSYRAGVVTSNTDPNSRIILIRNNRRTTDD